MCVGRPLGFADNNGGDHESFVVSQRNGHWAEAIEIPGTATANIAGDAQVTAVSCAPAGSCAATGYYDNSSGNLRAFIVATRLWPWHRLSTTSAPP
jgi:hypothetical protein